MVAASLQRLHLGCEPDRPFPAPADVERDDADGVPRHHQGVGAGVVAGEREHAAHAGGLQEGGAALAEQVQEDLEQKDILFFFLKKICVEVAAAVSSSSSRCKSNIRNSNGNISSNSSSSCGSNSSSTNSSNSSSNKQLGLANRPCLYLTV